MKYILLMSGTSAGVDGYHAWSKQDIEAHMAVLHRISHDLTASGEFVATQGLSGPKEAKMVRGEKNGLPVTDGIFPESKEFLLGYWIVDVATPERAYAIAGQISAAPGPVRQAHQHADRSTAVRPRTEIAVTCRESRAGSDLKRKAQSLRE